MMYVFKTLYLSFQSEYNGNILANASAADNDKKCNSPLYSFSKIMERISPEKNSPERSPQTLRGVSNKLIDCVVKDKL